MIPLINVGWSIHSILDHIFVPAFLLVAVVVVFCFISWQIHTLFFLDVCINLSSSPSLMNSFLWSGFMCINLLSLSLNLPGFAFLNGSPWLPMLMDLKAFLFNAIADTPYFLFVFFFVFFFFFCCYLTDPRPIVGHSQGHSLNNLILITVAFFNYFNRKATRSLITRFGP